MTVRAELSRLRRHLGGLIESRPYRFSKDVRVRVLCPEVAEELLPGSTAPGVRSLRQEMYDEQRARAVDGKTAT